jgi:ankyrin repeat protein
MCAAAGHDDSIVHLPLDPRGRYDFCPDLAAETIEILVKHGAIVDARDDRGRTALMCASRPHNREALLALLKYGADPNAKDYTGLSVWMYSLSYQSDVQTILKKSGAKP